MNNNERLNLQKMIDENNVVDCTNDIREKKHSTNHANIEEKVRTISIIKS